MDQLARPAPLLPLDARDTVRASATGRLADVRHDDWIVVVTVGTPRVRARRRLACALDFCERLAAEGSTRSAVVVETGPGRVVLTLRSSDVEAALDVAEDLLRQAGRRSPIRTFVCARRRPETWSQTLLRARTAELRAGRTAIRATLVC